MGFIFIFLLYHVFPHVIIQSRTTNIATQPSNEGDSELVGDTDGQGFGIGVVSGRICVPVYSINLIGAGSTISQAECVTSCCYKED